MVDVRRLKMLQMVQLFKCEEDALQVKHKPDQSSLWSICSLSECMTVFRLLIGSASCWTLC